MATQRARRPHSQSAEDLVSLIAEGRTNKEIAHAYGVSCSAIDKRIGRLLARVHAPNRAALVKKVLAPTATSFGDIGPRIELRRDEGS